MKKTYHPPATPCERLLEHPLVEESTKEALRKQLIELDPVTLLHGIRQGQSALAALSQGDPGNGPERQSLSRRMAPEHGANIDPRRSAGAYRRRAGSLGREIACWGLNFCSLRWRPFRLPSR
jgi:hypothetical protein